MENGVIEHWGGTLRDGVAARTKNINSPDRTHLGLNQGTPGARPAESLPDVVRTPRAEERIGGLHHRYTWATAV